MFTFWNIGVFKDDTLSAAIVTETHSFPQMRDGTSEYFIEQRFRRLFTSDI